MEAEWCDGQATLKPKMPLSYRPWGNELSLDLSQTRLCADCSLGTLASLASKVISCHSLTGDRPLSSVSPPTPFRQGRLRPPFQPPPPSSPPPPSLNPIEEQPKTRTHPDLPLYNLCNSSPSSDLHSFLLLLLLLLLRLVLLDCS
ncbi:hypothetical protein SDJN03_28852, partial [Cucurbita argyrosperma subsp. sororia]